MALLSLADAWLALWHSDRRCGNNALARLTLQLYDAQSDKGAR